MFLRADPHASGYSGSEWSQQGKSVSEAYSLPSTRTQLGMPAYDLRRFTEGPSLYLNGPPDAGEKRLLATKVQAMRHGHFSKRKISRELTQSVKINCNKTKTGPDPYNVAAANLWSQGKGSPRFKVGSESRVWIPPRPDCARSLNLDPYSVSNRDNPWRSFGKTSSARAATGMGRSASPSLRSARPTSYFSLFPESLSIGSRAHTPHTPHTTCHMNTTWTGANTERGLSGANVGGRGSRGVSSGGFSSPSSLPPLPAACRF